MPASTEAFIQAVQMRCARVAVGASTVRGQRAPGLVAKAREHLAVIPLTPFGASSAAHFRSQLDRQTVRLARALPPLGRSWGVARKLLNIFLRDALYTVYLRDHFNLSRAESLLELPLDSITVRRLRAEVGRGQLPPWQGVKNLTKAESAEFQAAAAGVAAARSIARVHLDAFWWSYRPESPTGRHLRPSID